MKMWFLFLAIALGGLFSLQAALAQQEEKEQPPAPRNRGGFDREAMLKKYDTNGDGKLDEQERQKLREDMRAQRAQRGGQGGQPRRGNWTPPEPPKPEELLKKFDADGDGKLDLEELKKLMAELRPPFRGRRPGGPGGMTREEMIKKYDANKDGELDEQERAKMREEMWRGRGGQRDGRGPGQRGRRGPGGRGGQAPDTQ